jgi:hypothetical protein
MIPRISRFRVFVGVAATLFSDGRSQTQLLWGYEKLIPAHLGLTIYLSLVGADCGSE